MRISDKEYTSSIDGEQVVVKISESAYKHGKSSEDILAAMRTAIFDETLEQEPNKTLIVGYDANANLIEVIAHVISDERIVVFHAMPCRKKYFEKAIGR